MAATENAEMQAPLARGTCDGDDRLLVADAPLAQLQLRCGGDIPGPIAIPELRELVAKVRRFGLKLARPVAAQDGEEAIRAWIEASPTDDGGCALAVHSWQASPLAAEPPDRASRHRVEIDRALAELIARLDARQGLLTAEADGEELAPLAEAMRGGVGRPWTDFVTLPGSSHRQPLHWRLLDGASVELPGSDRKWRASLIPHGAPEGGPGADIAGFELCLTAMQPPAAAALTPPTLAPLRDVALIGQDLAPVLRQPIARILANAETIRQRLAGPLAEEYRAYAGDIAAAAGHLQDLVSDLVDLEAVEAEGFATAPDAIDLVDVARRACGILSMRAREKDIALVLPAEGAAAPAIAEFRRVLQILLNLVGNAIRYAPLGTHIRLVVPERKSKARIVVADEGPGLSEADAARVFDKFERLGRSGDGGTGLGLYISRRLARAMGGELKVKSQPGEGARFILDLPKGG